MNADWPAVSIIVLNQNGLAHLGECLSSIEKLDYDPERLELMMVDNASTDRSVEFVKSNHQRVRVVQSTRDRGFAGGNNLGAREAAGDYVVFLGNDVAVHPRLVRGLVETVGSDPEAVSVGAKILSSDGTRFDFAGAICNFAGHAGQVGLDEPYDAERYHEIVPMLFASGSAMAVDRQVFLDVGGFDEDYLGCLEDVDLGWRLWLLGHKVLFAPEAVANRLGNRTAEKLPSPPGSMHYERNALCTVLKNYGDENLGDVLPAVLFAITAGVVETAADQDGLDLESFCDVSQRNGRKKVAFQQDTLASLAAVQQVAGELPRWMEKRRQVQDRRKRSDEEITHLFRPFATGAPWRWPTTAYSVTEGLGVRELFAGAPRRILVVSPDVLPYPGLPTVGSALRTWALGQGLRTAGHEVVFSMPRSVLAGHEDRVPADVARLAWEPLRLGDLLQRVKPDAVLVCGWGVLNHLLQPPDVPVILDQHGPHMLERQYQGDDYAETSAAEKVRSLRMADYFTCAGQRQLAYFGDWLERAGWSAVERAQRAVAVPVSLSPELPDRQPSGELTFVHGGMFLPWQDPSVGLETLVDELDRRQEGKLLLFGGRHPAFDGGVMEDLAKRLGESQRVVAGGMVTHDELVDSYARSDVAIDLMKSNPERQLAITTRTIEYLWCGLPVIYNDYAELADPIRQYEAGWTVDPENAEAIRGVISDIFDDPAQLEERGRNAQRLVRERFTWDNTIAPVDHFVRHPSIRRRPTVEDRVSALMPVEVALQVQRIRAKVPPSVERPIRRVLGVVAGTKGQAGNSDDTVIPIEIAVLVNRLSRGLPPPVARAARGLLRRSRPERDKTG